MNIKYYDIKIEELLNNGWIRLENEYDTIEIVQRVRKMGLDMDRVDFDLKTFEITIML